MRYMQTKDFFLVLAATTIAGAALLHPADASPAQASGCECPASIGPLVPSPFSGGAGSNCYPLSNVVDVYIHVQDDGQCDSAPGCSGPAAPCAFDYDVKITGSAPCRIGITLDGRLLGAGWIGSDGAFLECIYSDVDCGGSSVVEAIYGTGASPLFSITNTCTDC